MAAAASSLSRIAMNARPNRERSRLDVESTTTTASARNT